MILCSACGHYVFTSAQCPQCGASGPARTVRITAAALLLGLSACTGADTDKASDSESGTATHTGSIQADYGVPSTYTDSESGDTGGT